MEFDVKVGGDFACFTRPEFGVERVSYLAMTPSAARGLLEAIFWKPEFKWEIRQISVLNPIKQMSILRNEISDRQGQTPIVVERKRQQRTSLVLRDVRYVIRAEIMPRLHLNEPMAKYTDQFRRRIERGQYHHVPYLGTREFAAWVEPTDGSETPLDFDMDLGTMLFDIAYVQNDDRQELQFVRHEGNGRRVVDGFTESLFFQARINAGVLSVPRELYARLTEMEMAS